MEKQDRVIVETLQKFLERFNCAYESIENPLEVLEEFFELEDDWDEGIIYVHLKTSEWLFSHWYILDIKKSNTEAIVKWIKQYTRNILRFEYWLNV